MSDLEPIKSRTDCRELFAKEFPKHFRQNGNSLCPWHADNRPSLQLERDHLFCHSERRRFDVFDIVQKARGCDFQEAKRILEGGNGTKATRRQGTRGKIVQEYDYCDESGNLLYQTLRLDPKGFRQRRPDGKGGWHWNLNNTRLVLYRLPGVVDTDSVWFCEGEKDADNLHNIGLCGTTAPMGADEKGSKWPGQCKKHGIQEPLTNKTVYILPDNDVPGKEHAKAVAESLKGIAKCVKIIELPDLPKKGDVSDFINQHGHSETKRMLLDLAEASPEYVRQRETEPEPVCKAPDAMRSLIQSLIQGFNENRVKVDNELIALEAFRWLKDHGARFFKTSNGEPFMSYKQRTYWLNSGSRLRRGQFEGFLFHEAGLLQIDRTGKALSEGIRHLCLIHGLLLEELSWSHSDIDKCAVYFALNDEEQHVVRISPDGVSIIPNGDNEYGVLLTESPKIEPVTYIEDSDPARGWDLIEECFSAHLSCGTQDQIMISLWVASFLLSDFASTRPILRVEGTHGSGKTFLSKLLSTLIYGKDYHQKYTVAAAYADAEKSPIQCIDNFEAASATPDFLEYLLIASTGGIKQMRVSGTDAQTIILRPKALIHTNGIDPCGSALGEILRRTFTVRFDSLYMQPTGFLEADCVAKLKRHRNEILSYLFGVAARALKLVARGALVQVKSILDDTLDGHSKAGCNDFLALMYLVQLVSKDTSEVPFPITNIQPSFLNWIRAQDADSLAAGAESNQIAAALGAVFAKGSMVGLGSDAHRSQFTERYHVEVIEGNKIDRARSNDLFVALSTVSRDANLPWDIKSAWQLGARIKSDQKAIREAGFEITKTIGRGRQAFYSIDRIDGERSESESRDRGFTETYTI